MPNIEENKKKLIDEILELKKKRNAIIVAHYYQKDEIQAIADIVGDSYLLAKKCAESDADVICFCGVHFMAESAKILSPKKTVIIPDETAGCRMADMITAEQLKEFKSQHPGAKVMCYINTTAEVKSESDVSVTSSNAVKIAKEFDAKEILFVPDQNLGSYIAKQVPDKKFIMWDGYCPAHHFVTVKQVLTAKEQHPNAQFIVHPECTEEVVELADFVGSTQAILNYAIESDCQEFIVGTEEGILYKLKEHCPDKKFYMASEFLQCPNMKQIDLETLRDSLRDLKDEVVLDESIIEKAKGCLETMLELAAK